MVFYVGVFCLIFYGPELMMMWPDVTRVVLRVFLTVAVVSFIVYFWWMLYWAYK